MVHVLSHMKITQADLWKPLTEAASSLALPASAVAQWVAEGALDSREEDGRQLVSVAALEALASRATSSSQAVFTRADPSDQRLAQQLQRANHLAQVGTMALSIGHEINNPLTYVIGNNEYLKKDILASLLELVADNPEATALVQEALELTNDIEDGASHIKNVVANLSGMARRQNESALVDLHDIISRSLQMAHPTLSSVLKVQTELSEVGQIVMNEVHLTQILMNLLTNAAYAVQGDLEPSIIIRCFERGEHAVVEVEDNGSGIAPRHLERIFDPFFTTKPVGEGTGLGLSVCRQLLTTIGGSMDITSALGHGTTVRVLIPLLQDDQAPAQQASAAAQRSETLRVLVLDNDEAVLRSIKNLLDAHGISVDTITHATGVLQAIQAETYDVYLCDLMMSGRTGMALYRDVTTHCPEYLSKLVFMTGGAATEEAKAFAYAHRDQLVSKPLVFEALEACLLRAHHATPSITEGCPNVVHCPMFPRFTSGKMLSIYRSIYCETLDGSHQQCARYQMMSKGTRPPPTLLPNGDSIRDTPGEIEPSS